MVSLTDASRVNGLLLPSDVNGATWVSTPVFLLSPQKGTTCVITKPTARKTLKAFCYAQKIEASKCFNAQ